MRHEFSAAYALGLVQLGAKLSLVGRMHEILYKDVNCYSDVVKIGSVPGHFKIIYGDGFWDVMMPDGTVRQVSRGSVRVWRYENIVVAALAQE